MTLTRSVNVPTKYVQNPLFEGPGENTATWDYDKNYCVVLLIGGVYKMWYAGNEAAYTYKHLCYATSEDGLTWTKPNLGLVSYGGNTNNNIILGMNTGGVINPSVVYDPDAPADRRYMVLTESNADSSGGAHLYKSADGIHLTYVQSLTSIYGYIEAKELVKRHDGHWIIFYRHAQTLRKLGAMISKTTDPTGEWCEYGLVLDTAVVTDQKYSIGVYQDADVYYGILSAYNNDTGQMWDDLYISRDCLTWTLVKADWLPLGAADSWDDQMIINGKSMVRVGNTWRFYYPGFATGHAGPLPFDSRIGLATIGYRRIGQVAGTGTLTTTAITPAAGEKLYINGDASGGGKIEVEVLEGGSPKTGYVQADCTDITTDTYETEVTWGGLSLPTGAAIQLKFYLTGATLYSYEIK